MTIVPLPVEDMYPRPGARPVDDALVDKIADSMRLVGFVESRAVEVRPAGNTYVIIDGQHRVEAAKRAGLATIPAKVEEADDAAALTYEGVLNIQRPDTDAERFARAQDFFDLGDAAAPQQIAVATGISPELQQRVKRVRELVGDPVAIRDQGSLERILALDEFADDAEAVDRILHAAENMWQSVVRELRTERQRAENVAKAEAIIAEAGVELVEVELGQSPSDGDGNPLGFLGRHDEKPEGATHAHISTWGWSPSVDIYWYGTVAADPEADRKWERDERRRSLLEAAAANRVKFIVEYLNGHRPGASNALRDFACTAWEAGWQADSATLEPEPWSDVHGFLSRIYAAVLASVESRAHQTLMYDNRWSREHHGADVLAYFDALTDSGYVPVSAEQAALAEIRTVVEEADAT